MNSEDSSKSNDSDHQVDDDLMRLLAEADPASSDGSVERLQESWSTLSAGRRKRRAWMRAGAYATAAAVLVAVGVSRIPNSGQEIAEKPVEQAVTTEETAQGPASTVEVVTSEPQLAAKEEQRSELMLQFEESLADKNLNQPNKWQPFVLSIRQLPLAHQRELVFGVPEIEEPQQRKIAARAILAAAGSDAQLVLRQWMTVPSMQSQAWKGLVEISQPTQWDQLARAARDQRQRDVLCEHLVSRAAQGGINQLVELAKNRNWRSAVQRSAKSLPVESFRPLLAMIDQDSSRRLGAGFVLQSMTADTVDVQLAQMIVQGRYRMAAYQALLMRDTKQARQFLSMSAANENLSPALAAAWRRWSRWGPQASKWVTEIRRHEDENDNAQYNPIYDNQLACGRAGDEPVG